MTDQELIEACLRGNRKAQDALYARYAGRLFAVCLRFTRNRMEAEDLLQEGFVRIFKKLDTVRKEQEAGLFPWMRRVMVNLILNYLRDHKQSRFTEDVDHYSELITEQDEEEVHYIFESVKPEEILDIIRDLPDGYRTVFNLYAFENYAHQDIAAALGISVSTSKTQLMKARKMIAARLQKKIESKSPLKLVV